MARPLHVFVNTMSASDRSIQTRRDVNSMSHVAMAALAASVPLLAALVLVTVSRKVHDHPGAVLLVLLGLPILVALYAFIAKYRRAHGHAHA
jgi:hypothetical protein